MLYNSFSHSFSKFLNGIQGDHATMHNNYEGTANVHLQFMDGLHAPRCIISVILSSCQHCDEQ